MRGMLIDPYARVVREVDVENTTAAIKALLGIGDRPIAAYPRSDKHVAYCDDEGLLIDQTGQAYFNFIDRPEAIIAGRVLLFDIERGKDRPYSGPSAEKVLAGILWRDDLEFGGIDEAQEEITTPFGPGVLIRRTARWNPRGGEP